MRFAVREARGSDAAAIVALVRRFNVEEGNPPVSLGIKELSQVAFGDRPRFRALVAENRGEIVGYAGFFPTYDTEHAR
jgi:hypothetical protein